MYTVKLKINEEGGSRWAIFPVLNFVYEENRSLNKLKSFCFKHATAKNISQHMDKTPAAPMTIDPFTETTDQLDLSKYEDRGFELYVESLAQKTIFSYRTKSRKKTAK